VKQSCETTLLLEPLRLGSGKWLFGKLWEIQANDLDRCGPHNSRSDRRIHVTVDYVIDGKVNTRHIYHL
jgi:hypothetical protein